MLWIITVCMFCSGFHSPTMVDQDAPRVLGSFKQGSSIAVDPAGSLYVLDAETNELLKMNSSGIMTQSTGGFGWSEVAFDRPGDLTAPNGLDVFVADYGNHRIQHFDRNLNYVSTLYFRDNDDVSQRFGYPKSVSISRLGDLFLIDGENNRIVKIINNNTFDRAFGGQGSGAGQLQNPSRIRVSATDLVYVQDGRTLKVFDLFGNYVRSIGGERFSGLKTFTLDRQKVYILDSCTVRILSELGEEEQSFLLSAEHDAGENCDVRDIAVQSDFMYELTSHHIIQQMLPPSDRPEH